MIYLSVAAVLGICVGIFSIYHQRTFMVILLGLPPIIIGCINFFAPTLMVLGVNEGSGMSGVMNMYYGLPKVIQTSIIVFPMCLFIGRMFAWLRVRLGKPKQECPKARKKRILKEYGYTKMPEWH